MFLDIFLCERVKKLSVSENFLWLLLENVDLKDTF